MLKHRLLLGPLLVLALVGVLWLDEALEDAGYWPALGLTPLAILLCTIGAIELDRIFRAQGYATSALMTCVGALAGLAACGLTPSDIATFSSSAMVCTAGVLVLIASMVFYARHQSAEGVVSATSATLMAFVYLGLLGGFLIVLRKEFSAWVVLSVLLVTKACDIGAYFTGRFLGRRKLIPWLSPGKTWEGLAGGVLASALVGLAAAMLSPYDPDAPRVAPLLGLAIGAVFGLVGQSGDLIASLMKRDAGLKDSSSALPGFGGVLDVIDSPLLVAPAAYWVLAAISG